MANGSFVKEDRVATFKDLDINEEEKEIVLEDEINDDDLNKDFFQMEEREI